MAEISVVIPVFGCRECLHELHRRLAAGLGEVTPDHEIVFIDDRSTDGAWDVLAEIAASDPRVKAYRLSRNFGQHAAITAGLAHSTGRWTVVMDCDLQEPPEEIPRLYAKAQEGYDIVYTRRAGRRHSWFRRQASRAYLRLLRFLVRVDVDPERGMLSILRRPVVDAFLSLRDRDREYRVALAWLGFEHATIDFPHAEGAAGRSSYTLASLVRVALDGMFFQTTVLLRWVVYLGFAFAALSFAAVVGFLIDYVSSSNYPPGWASIFVAVVFCTGVIIISTGVTGLYVGRIFGQVKGRPLYIVDTAMVGGRETVAPKPAEEAEPAPLAGSRA